MSEKIAFYVLLGGFGVLDLISAAEKIHAAVLYRRFGYTEKEFRGHMLKHTVPFGPVSYVTKRLLAANARHLARPSSSYPTSL